MLIFSTLILGVFPFKFFWIKTGLSPPCLIIAAGVKFILFIIVVLWSKIRINKLLIIFLTLFKQLLSSFSCSYVTVEYRRAATKEIFILKLISFRILLNFFFFKRNNILCEIKAILAQEIIKVIYLNICISFWIQIV